MVNIENYFPSKKKILSSLRLRSREYLRENTLHGFPYFVNPQRPLWDRTIWFIATMAAIISAILIIISIYNKFESQPTLTRLDTDTEELHTYFPSLTLCVINPVLNLGEYEADSEHYNLMYNWLWDDVKGKKPKMDLSGETYSQFFYRISPECEDLYENCYYFGKNVPCGTIFKKKIFARGVCCFAEATEITVDNKTRTVAFDAKVFPLSLDLLSKDDLPPGRHAARTYLLLKGTALEASIKSTYSTPGVEDLRQSQRECLVPEENLSYGMCYRKCAKNRMLEKCHCLPWFMMHGDENKECTMAQYSCIKANVSLNFDDCNCYLSCNRVSYNLEGMQMSQNNHVEISIPNWPGTTFICDTRFGWLDLLVSFGGIAGVFVGYSLLTTVELAYYIFLRTYCGAVLDKSQNTIKEKEKKSKLTSRRKVINVEDLRKPYYNYVD